MPKIDLEETAELILELERREDRLRKLRDSSPLPWKINPPYPKNPENDESCHAKYLPDGWSQEIHAQIYRKDDEEVWRWKVEKNLETLLAGERPFDTIEAALEDLQMKTPNP